MTGDLPTPPNTPGNGRDSGSKSEGAGHSNVNNKGIHNQGGVVAGNIYGYNLIIGTINVAVDSATNLSGNIHSFLARVEIATQRLRSVADKVGATASTLGNIKDLVVKQAKNDGISLPKNPSEIKLPIEDGSKPKGLEKEESEVLKLRCFKNIISASKGVHNLFKDFSEKIKKAGNAIDVLGHTDHQTRPEGLRAPSQPQKDVGGDKLQLTEAGRESFYLTEKDIDFMESEIESHKSELLMRFTVFQFALNDEKREVAERVIVDCWRMIKMLSERLLKSGQDPSKDPRDYGLHHWPGYQNHQSFEEPVMFPNLRHLGGPNIALFTPFYMGWTFYKVSPPDNPPLQLSRSQKPSWLFSVPIRMLLSTEELYLKVIAQISARAQHGRLLEDDCAILLKSQSRRALVDKLLRTQNTHLQKLHPQVEWILAGLSSNYSHDSFNKTKKRNKHRPASESGKIQKSIEVILKTQWRASGPHPRPGPGPQLRHPIGVGGPNLGWSMHPNPNFDGGPNNTSTRIPPHHTGSTYPVSGGVPVKARANRSSDYGFTPASNHRAGHQPHGEHKILRRTRPHPRRSYVSRDETAVEVRKPEFRFVREPGKKTKTKAKQSHENSNRSVGRARRVYIELCQPGLYYHKKKGRDKRQPRLSPHLLHYPPPHLPSRAHHPRPPQFRPQPVPSHTPSLPVGIDEHHIDTTPPSPQETASIEEENEVVEELFEEWEELTDKKGKKTSRMRSGSDSNMGISRAIMTQVERQSHYRMMKERHSIERMTVEMKMQPQTPSILFAKSAKERRQGGSFTFMSEPTPIHQEEPYRPHIHVQREYPLRPSESYRPHIHVQREYPVRSSAQERFEYFHSDEPRHRVHVQEVQDYSGESDRDKDNSLESRVVDVRPTFIAQANKRKTKHTRK